MEERTGWRGQNESQIGGKEKWQTCWCCRDQQVRPSRPFQKEKKQSLLSGLPDREGERAKEGESRTLASEVKIRAEA